MERADILIHGCIVLPMNSQAIIEDGAIAIKDGRITFVGKRTHSTGIRADLKIDGKRKAALPGMINCHTHMPMTLFRGLAEDQPLSTWLKGTIWPLEAQLTPEDIYSGSLLGCLEMIKSGTTCFADMYFHEDRVAEAVKKSGLRAALAEGIIESGNKELGEKMFKAGTDFAERFRTYANGLVTTMFGPHSAYSCSRELLTRIRERAQQLNVGIHMHVAESKELFSRFEEKYGLGEVQFLDAVGLLKNNLVAAHCICLSDTDRQVFSKRGVNVVYVPVANMKLGLGTAGIRALADLGVNMGLGTDGPASNNSLDMFETMKVGALLQKLACMDPTVLPAYEVLRMASINGAKALGLKEVGSLEVGKRADIILTDLTKPHLTPLHNIYASIVYSAHGSDVDTVIVDGKVLMENRHVETLDEQAVLERAEKASFELVSHERMAK